MAVRHQFLWLIYILHCVGIHSILDINNAESCDLLCKQCNASAVFADDRCECNFSDNKDKGAECLQCIQREIQAIDLNTLSEDLTDEERSVRSSLKSRHHLKTGDAEKVAQYFIKGGPAAGHSHFINIDSATNSFSSDGNSPKNEFHGEKPLNSVSWNTYDSPLYLVPEAGPYTDPAMFSVATPIIGMIKSDLSYPANGLYDATKNSFVGSIIHPHRRGYKHHRRTLHRKDNLSAQILYLFGPHCRSCYRSVLLRSSNDRNRVSARQSSNDDSKDLSIAKNNTDKPVEQNVSSFLESAEPMLYPVQTPCIFDTSTVYQPAQNQRSNVPYQYTSYHNPLINLLYPITEYTVQSEYSPQYVHGISNSLISVSNPSSYCANNANTK